MIYFPFLAMIDDATKRRLISLVFIGGSVLWGDNTQPNVTFLGCHLKSPFFAKFTKRTYPFSFLRLAGENSNFGWRFAPRSKNDHDGKVESKRGRWAALSQHKRHTLHGQPNPLVTNPIV